MALLEFVGATGWGVFDGEHVWPRGVATIDEVLAGHEDSASVKAALLPRRDEGGVFPAKGL